MDARKNFAVGTLASGINSAATSLSVGAGEGSRFPAVSFNAVIWQSTDYASPAEAYQAGHAEIVRVTNIATDTFTITRAQESTSAVNLNTGGKTYKIFAGPTDLYWDESYVPGEVLTTRGDLIRRGSSVPERLAVGAFGTFLVSDGTDPSWFLGQNFTRVFDDFMYGASSGQIGETSWTASVSGGTIAAGSGEATRPGLVILSTSTSSTGLAQILKTATSLLFGAGAMVFDTAVKLSDLSDGTETYSVKIGWLDNFSVTDGVYFSYTHSVNSGQWRCTATNNSTSTNTDSVVAVTTSWVRLTIVVNAAGTSAEFFVDGSSVGTVATNIPTTTGRETGARVAILKSAGTTARTLSVDYVSLVFKPTTSR